MDLNLTPEEQLFQDELRAWLGTHAPKNWQHRRDESVDAHFAFLRQWQHTLYEGGWAGISWPRDYGGRGASLMQQVIFWQEMALAGAPPMANVLGLGLVGPTIIAFGTDAQKTRFLRKILSAEEIWCQGFSEPNAGSDLAEPADGGAPRRRSLRRQRPEGVDQLRVGRRLVRARASAPIRPRRSTKASPSCSWT